MKRIFLTSCFLFITLFLNAQISLSANVDGYWGGWKKCNSLTIQGSYGGFIIYDKKDSPWNWMFKFTINGFYIPDSKNQKQHRKNGTWYEFKGTVEYYISDSYQSAYEAFKNNKGPGFVDADAIQKKGWPVKKVTSNAKIRIQPYDNSRPKVYNIWYDNVGLGIDLGTLYFN